MPTECNAALFDFAAIGRREVVADFDGGSITSDAGHCSWARRKVQKIKHYAALPYDEVPAFMAALKA